MDRRSDRKIVKVYQEERFFRPIDDIGKVAVAMDPDHLHIVVKKRRYLLDNSFGNSKERESLDNVCFSVDGCG